MWSELEGRVPSLQAVRDRSRAPDSPARRMTRVDMLLAITQRLQAAHDDLRALGCRPRSGIHRLDRETFDAVGGSVNDMGDFWAKDDGDVTLYTNEPPVRPAEEELASLEREIAERQERVRELREQVQS